MKTTKSFLDWISREFLKKKKKNTCWEPFYFSFFSKLDRSSTDWVWIILDREPLIKKFNILIDRKMVSISRNLNKTDLIYRVPIEDHSNQPEAKFFKKSRDFQSVEKHIQSIEILENWIFWKIVEDYAETTQPK